VRKSILVVVLTVVLAGTAVVTVVALNGDGREEEEIRNTVKAYARAVVQGDGARACRLFTPSARESVEFRFERNGGISRRPCPREIEKEAKRNSKRSRTQTLRAIGQSELDITTKGDRATVTSEDWYPVCLEKHGGEWLIKSTVGDRRLSRDTISAICEGK
jgi:hypothetical protein